MTYFGFLALFLGIPLFVLLLLTWRDWRRGRLLPPELNALSPIGALAGHVIVAVLYTTPWDNYLVATNVWWYNPELVTGVVLGWVPIEEYTFFVLQTIMTGLVVLFVAKRTAPAAMAIDGPHMASSEPLASPMAFRPRPRLRWVTSSAAIVVWLLAVAMLVLDWQPGTYLALILVWAIPPILFQLVFGADILWHFRRPVFWSLVAVTLYLGLADAIAIASGTWTIDPQQSTGVLLGNLPIEEFLFFLVTNTLVVFGMTLVLARESQHRVRNAVP